MELKQSGYFLARTLSYEVRLLLCRPATLVLIHLAHLMLLGCHKANMGTSRHNRALCHM